MIFGGAFPVAEDRADISVRVSILFFIISFMGWCFEKIARYFVYGSTADRGFLSMPICPIYGFSIILIYLLIGSPYSPRIGIRRDCGRTIGKILRFILNLLIYFILATLISTAAELVTGMLFKEAFGVTLWSYESQPYSLGGYICLGYSLLWGAMITVFMLWLWQPLCSAVWRIGKKRASVIALMLCGIAVADFAFNTLYAIVTGEHFNFL